MVREISLPRCMFHKDNENSDGDENDNGNYKFLKEEWGEHGKWANWKRLSFFSFIGSWWWRCKAKETLL